MGGYAGLGYAGIGYAGLGHQVAAGYSNASPSASMNIAGLAPAAVPAVGGLYAGAGRYVANSAGTIHVAKREADPYYAAGYGLGYAGLGYAGLGYAGLGYGVHHAAGYASVSPSASVNIAGLAPAAVPAVGGLYAGAGRYVANSAGTVHVAKREAEADADAYYAAGYGLGYAAGLGYAGLGHHVAAGYSNVSPSGSLNIAGLAPAAIPAVGGAYAGAGRYVANSAGTVHVA